VHLVLFLIVLVANASGGLTPLGNPPLYIGLLHGVPFFWPTRHLILPLLVVSGLTLAAFFMVDQYLAAGEPAPPMPAPFRIRGWLNIGLIALVVLGVLLQGVVRPGEVILFGQPIGIERLAGVLLFLAIALVSVGVTPRAVRQGNDFTWHPMAEVAMLFAAIFITIGPVIDMLQTGMDGPLAPLLRLTLNAAGEPNPIAYFWLTGVLSAFLDNAPTYLVFFELAGLKPPALSGGDDVILTAISAGAVFFGGLTYIGNAPNMMLRSIAAHRGVRMPGFFGFMLWSSALLLPVLAIVSLLFFV
jgi:Na+/H+ antiporter NhaD/arsenite permease-like protein